MEMKSTFERYSKQHQSWSLMAYYPYVAATVHHHSKLSYLATPLNYPKSFAQTKQGQDRVRNLLRTWLSSLDHQLATYYSERNAMDILPMFATLLAPNDLKTIPYPMLPPADKQYLQRLSSIYLTYGVEWVSSEEFSPDHMEAKIAYHLQPFVQLCLAN